MSLIFPWIEHPHIDFDLFEENNPQWALNVYIENPKKKEKIKVLFLSTREKGDKTINLLLDTENKHFTTVSRKTALLRQQIGGRHATSHFCEKCDVPSKSKNAKDNHEFLCKGNKKIVFLPRDIKTGEVPKIKFSYIPGLLRCPFVGTADSEDFLHPVFSLKDDTQLVQEHNASAWGYALSTPLKKEVEYVQCYSENPTDEFVKELIKRAILIFHGYWEPSINTSLGKDFYLDKDLLIVNDESIDFSCRYYLQEREMPKETRIIGRR